MRILFVSRKRRSDIGGLAKFTQELVFDFKKKGFTSFPKDNKIKCDCGFEINLGGMRNDIEVKTGLKVLD